jgi:hypothetical protein
MGYALIDPGCLARYLLMELIVWSCRWPRMLISLYSHWFVTESPLESLGWSVSAFCWHHITVYLPLVWIARDACKFCWSENVSGNRSLTRLCTVAFFRFDPWCLWLPSTEWRSEIYQMRDMPSWSELVARTYLRANVRGCDVICCTACNCQLDIRPWSVCYEDSWNRGFSLSH